MSLRQLNFAVTDLEMHAQYVPQAGKTIFDSDLLKEITKNTTVMAPLPEDRRAASPLISPPR